MACPSPWAGTTAPILRSFPSPGAERLVVVRGLGSLLNGPNAQGGSIEVTHDAFGQPAGRPARAAAGVDQYGASVGTLGYGRRLADVGGGALSVHAGVAHRQRDGVALPGGVIDSTAQDGLRTGTDLQADRRLRVAALEQSAGRSLGFTVSGFDAEKGVPPEEHIKAPRLWRYPYNRRQSRDGLGEQRLLQDPAWTRLARGGRRLQQRPVEDRDVLQPHLHHRQRPGAWRRAHDDDARAAAALARQRDAARQLHGRRHPVRGDAFPAAAVNYRQKLSSTGVEIEAPLGGLTQVVGGVVLDRSSSPETGGRTPGQEPFARAGWRAGVSHDLNARVHAARSARANDPACPPCANSTPAR